MWFGTASGLSKFDGSTWINYTTDDGLKDNYIGSIAFGFHGDIWVSNFDFDMHEDGYVDIDGRYASKYDGSTWTSYDYKNGMLNDTINDIVVDKEGIIWFATEHGLFKYDGDRWTYIYTDYMEYYTGTRWVREDFSPGEGLESNEIRAISVDEYNVKWIATDRDITKFDGTKWTTYTESDGLVHENVWSIGIDHDGVKWFGTTQGISRFDDRQLNQVLHVVSPNGNEYLLSGSTQSIRWGIDTQELLTLEYSSDNGTSWNLIDDNVDAAALSYEWIIPELESDACLIRIIDNNNTYYVDESDTTFTISSQTHIDDTEPLEFALHPNHPNPFNPFTTIKFTLPSPGLTSLTIYNLMGQKVRELVIDELETGVHSIVWDGKDDHGMAVSSGIYLSRLRSGSYTSTRKMLLMK